VDSPDLTKLRIDRSLAPVRRRRTRRWVVLGVVAIALLLAAGFVLTRPRVVDVQTVAVVTAYPSQQFVVLNATGYVVAQRKAAIASKATGRLEWLGVAEGSRVKEGEVIARLDNRDVVAQADAARAQANAARASLDQTLAEERDALSQHRRNVDLVAKGFVSQSSLDTSKARADRAVAGVTSARAALAAGRGGRAQRRGRGRLHADPRAVRRRDPVEERERRRHGDAVLERDRLEGRGRRDGRTWTRSRSRPTSPSRACRRSRSASPPRSCSTRCPTRASSAASAAWCRPVDRAKATVMTKVKFDRIDPRVLPEMSAKVSFLSRDGRAAEQKPLTPSPPMRSRSATAERRVRRARRRPRSPCR
jgi:hypothetical protein